MYWTKGLFIQKHELTLGNISCGVSICLLAAASPAWAGPTGGNVAAGSAHIQHNGSTTVITQTSGRAVINWKDFSINTNESVRFIDPSARSVTLNRVTGGNTSQILGHITSNGQVFIVNPAGIIFGKTARVDVAGLLATTANITNKNFMAGNYHFTNAPAGSFVINEGTITIRQAGLAALVAPNVVNRGIIQAQLGRVALASGKAFTVDLYGDNLITFDASSTVKGSVENMGHIMANGGTVMLSAAAAEGIVENVVNTSGYISATSVSNKNGKIILQGYKGSQVAVSGTLDVSGKEAGQTGGVIQASADYVQLKSGSVLDASGAAGGGNIHIGSDVFHNIADDLNMNTLGLPTKLRTAQFVYAAPEATVIADALQSGKGGNVVVWGDNATWFYGSISAAAKGLTGNGGRIETSGHYLDVAGISVNASSKYGQAGIWLLDPFSVIIKGSGSSTNGSFSGTNPITWGPTAASNVFTTDINTQLATGVNVVISTGGGGVGNNITFDNTNDGSTPITWSGTNSLTLLAGGDIIFNASAAATNVINMTGTGTVYLRSDSGSTGTGTVTVNTGKITGVAGSNVAVMYNPTTFATAATDYTSALAAGSTTVNGYFLVQNGVANHNLSNITQMGGNYALATNMTTGLNTAPIGTNASPFTGIFTGSTAYLGVPNSTPFTITNLSIFKVGFGAAADIGFFGVVSTGTIDNITLVNPTIAGAALFSSIGGIIGRVSGAATISGSLSVLTGGTISGPNDETPTAVGGIIGTVAGGTITANLRNEATVKAAYGTINTSSASKIGGIIGSMTGGTLGPASGSSTITNKGTVLGSGATGGIIGTITGGTITAFTTLSTESGNTISSTGLVPGNTTGASIGGLFGVAAAGSFPSSASWTNNQTVTATTAFGTTNVGAANVPFYVGGVIGRMTGTATMGAGLTLTNTALVDVQNTPNVNGSFNASIYVGGVLGAMSTAFTYAGALNNSGAVKGYGGNNSSGSVTSGALGGVIAQIMSGTFSGTATNTGNVTGTSFRIGGVLGAISGGTISGAMTSGNGVTVLGTAATAIGGVVGALLGTGSGTGTSSFSTSGVGSVQGNGFAVGGIFGVMNGGSLLGSSALTNTYNVNNASATGLTGGIVGQMVVGFALGRNMTNSGNISNSASSSAGTGGIIGALTAASTSITGTLSNSGSVTNTGGSNVGGIFGLVSRAGSIANNAILSTTGTHTISGASNIGGLIGNISVANGISTSNTRTWSNAQTVTGTGAVSSIGGIFGALTSGTTIALILTNTGAVTANSATALGGIMGLLATGQTFSGILSNSGTISGTSSNVGGLFGSMTGGSLTGTSITNTGSITGDTNVGGLFGSLSGFTSITSATIRSSVGTITATTSAAGGIIGNLSTSFTAGMSTLNTLTVTGAANIGGLVGNISGTTGGLSAGANTLSNAATVNGTAGSAASAIGGIVGLLSSSSATAFTVAAGSITNTGAIDTGVSATHTNVGGLIGSMTAGTISTTGAGTITNTGSVGTAGFSSTVGGLIGSFSGGSITSTSLLSVTDAGTRTITGLNQVGGFIGVVTNGITALPGAALSISNATLTVSGTGTGIGGLFGEYNFATAYTQSMTSNVTVSATSANNVGGIVGLVSGTTLSGTLIVTGTITGNSNVGGLVGALSGTSLTGILTSSGALTAASSGLGGIVGYMTGTSGITLTAVTVSNTFSGVSDIGGVVGFTDGTDTFTGTFTNAALAINNGTNIGAVIGRASGSIGAIINDTALSSTSGINLGGVVGYMDTGSSAGALSNTGNITGTATYVGGVVGVAAANLTSGLSNSGTVAGSQYVGGLAGAVINSIIQGNYANSGTISATGDTAGGLAGHITGTTFGGTLAGDSFTNSGIISGTNNVGGAFGIIDGASSILSTVTMSNTGGTVTGSNFVGGNIGQLGGSTTVDSAAIFTVSGTTLTLNSGGSGLGGVVGYMTGSSGMSIDNVTVSGNTFNSTGASDIGGAVGLYASSGALAGTFAGSSLTINNGTNIGAIIGRTTTALGALTNSATLASTSGINVGGVVGATSVNLTNALSNSGNISGGQYVGGLIGELNSATLSGTLTSSGMLTATLNGLGGIVGYMTGASSIDLGNVAVTNTFSGTSDIGGVVGIASGTPSFTGILSNASVTVTTTATNVGAIIGQLLNALLSGLSANNTNLTADNSSNVGGLIGKMSNSQLMESSFAGTVTGMTSVGSIAGSSELGSSIETVYSNDVTVLGNTNVGGIVGYNDATSGVTNVLFGGIVDFTGTSAGGIVGLNDGSITTSLSIGSITGIGTIQGGIVGDNTLGTINDTFYSVNTYPGLSATGTGPAGTSQSGDYSTLYKASSFTPFGWSFPTVWSALPDHYVTLTWCGAACAVVIPLPPIPPVPTPPGPNGLGNFAAQYVTVEQILNDADLTNTPNYLDYGNTLTFNTVTLTGYGLPMIVVVTRADSGSIQSTALEALYALRLIDQATFFANKVVPGEECMSKNPFVMCPTGKDKKGAL